ncbi:MAG TPA: CatA-like O-acetyltransferase [Bacillota bacterium]|nr:CatA-like O-acetyltransferase [Bacillota bacterium]HPE37959.1 CatA-like O-acetyltransferase [Bacillota bacterium]
MKSQFFPYDNTWPRAQHFHYYANMYPTNLSVNIRLDVTSLVTALRAKNVPLAPAFYYMATKAINMQGELSVAYKDGAIGWWNYLNPTYPVFHEDDETVTLLWTEYEEDFLLFYEKYQHDIEKFGSSHGVISMKGMPPMNSFNIHYQEWFSFDGLSIDLHETKDYFFPSVDIGKPIEENGKILAPISITIHRAASDMIHVKKFFDDVMTAGKDVEEKVKTL